MHIVNEAGRLKTSEKVLAEFRAMSDPEILAQEIVQKGAVHALTSLLRTGVTEHNVRAALRDLEFCTSAVSAECLRRGLAVVEHPGSN